MGWHVGSVDIVKEWTEDTTLRNWSLSREVRGCQPLDRKIKHESLLELGIFWTNTITWVHLFSIMRLLKPPIAQVDEVLWISKSCPFLRYSWYRFKITGRWSTIICTDMYYGHGFIVIYSYKSGLAWPLTVLFAIFHIYIYLCQHSAKLIKGIYMLFCETLPSVDTFHVIKQVLAFYWFTSQNVMDLKKYIMGNLVFDASWVEPDMD